VRDIAYVAQTTRTDVGILMTGRPRQFAADALVQLVYELLDAHDDTARLAAGLSLDSTDAASDTRTVSEAFRWSAHLDYLRALQRRGRELLALTDARTPPD
jgi:hypothetical protein